jgi:Rieske Fe-S protein
LIWTVGGLFTAAVAAVAAALGGIFGPSAALAPSTRIPKRLADLVDGDVIPIQLPANWSLVTADGGGAIKAGDLAQSGFVVHTCGRTEVLAGTCSHLGCTLAYQSEQSRFDCPCHGSRYDLTCSTGRSIFAVDGTVIHGPAKFPMAHVKWRPGAAPDEIALDMLPSVSSQATK